MLDLNEISNVTNKVDELLMKSCISETRTQKFAYLVQALSASCLLLEKLSDENFYQPYSDSIQNNQNKDLTSLILWNSDTFERFLKVEHKLILLSGMDEKIVEWHIDRIAKEIDFLLEDEDKVSVDQLRESINTLKGHVCSFSQKSLSSYESYDRNKNLIKVFGGIAIILVNSSIVTLISPEWGQASSQIGAVFILEGARKFY